MANQSTTGTPEIQETLESLKRPRDELAHRLLAVSDRIFNLDGRMDQAPRLARKGDAASARRMTELGEAKTTLAQKVSQFRKVLTELDVQIAGQQRLHDRQVFNDHISEARIAQADLMKHFRLACVALGSFAVSVVAEYVARDGVEWNYVSLDGLVLHPRLANESLGEHKSPQ